jgi:SRSO17 transposase
MGRAGPTIGPMTRGRNELPAVPAWDALAVDFEAFHARFASLFARSESREEAKKYVRSLMGAAARRNGWQLAEAIGDRTPDRVQRLLYSANWSAEAARDRLRDFTIEQFGDPQAIGVLDETGFLKKGTESVGVARQYSGTAGKVENCQIGVFLSYASSRGHVLLDRRLYLPEAWCKDPPRMQRAHVPKDVVFQTKPQLARQMLEGAWQGGVPMAWVTGDEVYGDDPALRDAIAAANHRYVLAVASTTPVWPERPEIVEPPTEREHRHGPRRVRTRLAPGAPRASTVEQVVAQWLPTQWHRLAIHLGEKGPIEYDWACARVIDSRQRLPTDEIWLLARRSVSKPSEMAYYLSNADADTPLATLAHVASTRYTIEQCFEEAKDDVGLDHYEVRTWPSWHRYITLGMMALAWLASVRAMLPDEGAFPYAPVINAELVHDTALAAPGDNAAPVEEAALAAPAKEAEAVQEAALAMPKDNAASVQEPVLAAPAKEAASVQEPVLAAPGEKSPLPPKGAPARRRWLPGAFPKSAV